MPTYRDSSGNTYVADQPKSILDQEQHTYQDATNAGQAVKAGGTPLDVPDTGPSWLDIVNHNIATTTPADLENYKEGQAEANRPINAYEYGGGMGRAQGSSDYFNDLAIGAQGRKGEVIDYGDAKSDRADNIMARAGQASIAEAMRQRALGRMPTIASMEADRQSRQLAAQQSSAAASARGPAALALAQQGAAANTASGESAISNAAQINSANERRADEVAAFGAQTGIRQGDQSSQGMDAQEAAAQAQLNAQQRAQNDAYAQANYGNAIGINEFQSQAQQNRVAAEHGQYVAGQQLLNQQHASDRADLSTGLQIGGTALGAIGTGVALGTATGILGGPGSSNNAAPGTNPNPGVNYVTNNGTPQGGDIDPSTGQPKKDGTQGASDDGAGWPGTGRGYEQPTTVGGHFGQGGYGFGSDTGTTATTPKPTLASLGVASPSPAVAPSPKPTMAGLATSPSVGGPAQPRAQQGPPIAPQTTTPATIANVQQPQMASLKSTPASAFASDVRIKDGIEPEGNRVDRMLDGIHPLSYTYKDAASEPRSQPTGGRYLGISAQDLEAVPEVGHQMVSDGPRGKQIESGPTLSAAMAGMARLNQRVRGLESHAAGGHAAHANGAYYDRAAIKQMQHDSGREDLRTGAGIVGAGAGALGTGAATLANITSDIRAKEDVQREGAAAGARVAAPVVVHHPLAETPYEMAKAPPLPGAVPSMLDATKAVAGAGAALSASADGYEHAYDRAQPHVIEARRRAEAAIDEAAHRAQNVARAATGRPTLATVRHRSRGTIDDGNVVDYESMGPSGEYNRDEPDYNFIHSPSPLNVATAFEAHPQAITPGTEAMMRREGQWDGKTDALLRERGLRPTLANIGGR